MTTVAPVESGVPADAGLEAFAVASMQIITAEQVRVLQAHMADVQAKFAARQQLRQLLRQVTQERGRNPGHPASSTLVAEAHQALSEQLSAMSELGETESLRLQQAMDRMSKMMSTLSNIMKKLSDTDQSIIQNMK
ncbi:MAG TPA: EscF/YscF/HrpA family type III secretion system needle major subunit [Ktedonobacterales bacterium]|nr:EscF/YscF/HrpA family type III secretion system needle major subunit [Ktedonobacterales bacterium]